MKKIFTKDIKEFDNNVINKILTILFIFSIIAIPLDNLPYMENVLGELSVRGPIYLYIPIISLIGFYFIIKKQVYINLTTEKIIILIFILWTAVSSLLNANNILNNSFKGRAGLEKLILQILVISFMILVMYCTEFIIRIKNIQLKTIRKYISISVIICCMYSVLEVIQIYGIIDVENLITTISSYIHSFNRGVLYGDRVRSLTGEASFLGMYFAFAYPWIVSYIFTEKKVIKKIMYSMLTLFLLFLIYMTKSRTAYAIAYGEMALIFIGIIIFNKSKIKKILVVIITICTIFSISAFNKLNDYIVSRNLQVQEEVVDDGYNFEMSLGGLKDSLTSKTNHSNIARLGLQKSAIKMGIENPFKGVGLGQFGFNVNNYISEDARVSFEIQRWTDEKETNFWPPAFALYPRIVAEQGIVGLIIWSILILVMVFKLLKRILKKEENIMEIFMLVSFSGVVVSLLNADTYALPQLWILMGIITCYGDSSFNKEY